MRHRPGDVGLTARAVTQECTQIGQNGLSVSFWGICVHCCDVVVRRGDATVYTNGRIGPLGAVSGHSCTLLGCCAVVDRRGDATVYTDCRKRPLRTGLGHLCTLLRCESRCELRRELRQVARAPQSPRRAGGASSLAPPAWSGRQALREWRRCQAGIFAEASTHTNP